MRGGRVEGGVEDWVDGGIDWVAGGESGEWSTECSVLSTEGDLRQRVRGRRRRDTDQRGVGSRC